MFGARELREHRGHTGRRRLLGNAARRFRLSRRERLRRRSLRGRAEEPLLRDLLSPAVMTRREFLATSAKLGTAATIAGVLPFAGFVPRPVAAGSGFLSLAQRRTLDAALARMIPAD